MSSLLYQRQVRMSTAMSISCRARGAAQTGPGALNQGGRVPSCFLDVAVIMRLGETVADPRDDCHPLYATNGEPTKLAVVRFCLAVA
jgi:hypothetical protein